MDAVEVVVRDVTERLRADEQRLRAGVRGRRQPGGRRRASLQQFADRYARIYGAPDLAEGRVGRHARGPERNSQGQPARLRPRAPLLAFSDPKAPRPENLDLNDIVHGLHGRLSRELRDGQVLVVEQASMPAMIRIDAEDVQQVITQLVRNARDAMPSGGAIKLEVAAMADPTAEGRCAAATSGCASRTPASAWIGKRSRGCSSRSSRPSRRTEARASACQSRTARSATAGGRSTCRAGLHRGTTIDVYFRR